MSQTKKSISYEASDAQVPRVLVGVAILVGGIGLSLVTAAFVYRSASKKLSIQDAPGMSFAHGTEDASGIVRDWREQDKLVREHLESYAWVDQEKRLVRIPIERAMDLMIVETKGTDGGKP
jgi:hypothetical protein